MSYDIHNLPTIPSSQVKQYFYSRIPFGSEYYIYSVPQTQNGLTEYEMILRKVGTNDYEGFNLSRASTSSPYVLSRFTVGSAEEIRVDYPYYCYSSESSQGIVETLPSASNTNTMLLIVVASLAVLRTVFGGIRWVRSRKYQV